MTWLIQTCTISVRAEDINASGTTDYSLDTQYSNVPCNFQPDTSGKIIVAGQQLGAGGGKLFLLATQAIDSDHVVTIDGNEYRVAGPAVKAAGAVQQWVPIDREVP
jgi:hypothetical protein